MKIKNIFKNIKNKYIEIIKKINKIKNILNKKKYNKLINKYKKIKKIYYYYKKIKKNKENINFYKSFLFDKELKKTAIKNLKLLKIKKKIIFKKIKKKIIKKERTSSCYIEIHPGTGGKEANIFVKDLYKMYHKYIEIKKWKINILNINYINNFGYKEIVFKIKGKKAYKNLKYESGCHRVQRIPKTESQGRIHTSTCNVAVIPKFKKKYIKKINKSDLKIDTFKSSGSGGQHVNTTNSAIRIKHIPTGIISECQNERSQHQNKSKALTILKNRIYNHILIKKLEKDNKKRRILLGKGNRSSRNRTYNFNNNRITDHRINLNIYKLNEIMNGKLDYLIKPLIKKLNKI